MKLFLVVAFLSAAQSLNSPSSARKILDFPRFKLISGPMDSDGISPIGGAKLCTLQTHIVCWAMPPEPPTKSNPVQYEFGLEPVSERIPIVGGGSVVFFLAKFSGGGSGTLERAALLRYQPDGSIVNLLPVVAVTNVSQRQMWRLPEVSDYPVLVTADFIWDFAANETHFSDHRFEVEAYKYDPAQDHYAKVFSYRTTQKYAGGDSASVSVLQPEREEILRRLGVR